MNQRTSGISRAPADRRDGPLRVLLVEDQAGDAAPVGDWPGQVNGIEIDRVSSLEKARRAIRRGGYDAYLLDASLGQKALIQLLANAHERASPAVLIADEDASTALQAGASDSIPRSQLTPFLVERVLRSAIENQKLRKAYVDLEAALEARAREITRTVEEERGYILASAHCLTWSDEVTMQQDGRLAWTTRLFDVEAAQRLFPVEGKQGEEYVWEWHKARLPEDTERTYQEADRRVRAGESYQQEFRMRRADGALLWMYEDVRVETREVGQRWRVVGVVTDITERKQVEEALRKSELEHRVLVEAIPQMVWTAEPNGNQEYCNQRWVDYTGLSYTESRGSGWSAAVHPEDLPRCVDRWHHATATGEPYEIEYRLRRAVDGAYRWHLCRAVPVRDARGNIVEWFGTCTDIDDQKAAQQIAREAIEQLAEQDRRKDEFLAMLAHELRNPLSPILNAVQLLRARANGQRGVTEGTNREISGRAHDIIERQTRQLARLVDDLLDVARITHGNVLLQKQRVELGDLIRRAAEAVQPFIDSRRHHLLLSTPEAPVSVEGDPARLEQVLTNLLHNAAKFTEPDGQIEVILERRGQEAIVTIRDTGIGISAKLLPHVFGLFTQGDRSPARAEGGLGIGLSVVKRLVELHGGEIRAYSSGVPGEGSAFMLRLPCCVEQDPESTGPSTTGFEPSSGTLRVLVVDDNVDAADTVSDLLKMWGYQVDVAYSGEEALKAASRQPAEVLFCDIGLPGIDGCEVARHLQQRPETCPRLMVAVTGYGQDVDRRRTRAAGFDHHLTKPVDSEEIKRLLASADRR